MKYKDYYAILGLERGATDDAIKKGVSALARKYHPDVSKESNAEEKFKEVAEAYQTLKDADKRKPTMRWGRTSGTGVSTPARLAAAVAAIGRAGIGRWRIVFHRGLRGLDLSIC